MNSTTNKRLHRESPADLLRPRVDKEVEIITDLIQRHGMYTAPAKTGRCGDWFQVVIPIGKDHAAYLTLPEDSVDEIRRTWENGKKGYKSI